MKFPNPIPFGMAASSIRNWATSKKPGAYRDNYDRIFKKRTNRPGFTKSVIRNGKNVEFHDADKLSPSQMGIKMIVRGICD